MVFDAILGQDPAVQILRRALATGRVHHAYRFEGPAGVGKRTAAFALAQSLVCQRPQPEGCGECSACRRTVTLAEEEPHVPLHPDVLLVGRGIYPKHLLGKKGSDEKTGISVEQIRRVVLARAGYEPHEARALVVIVQNAEELTQSAANALLKTLEEPHAKVHFVLLTSRPRKLLDTVRSRSLAVRFGPLPDTALRLILEQRGVPTDRVALAQGSAKRALELLDDEQRERLEAFTQGMDRALRNPHVGASLEFLSSLPNDRDRVRAALLAFAGHLALEGRSLATYDPPRAATRAHQYQAVERALTLLERNVSTTLTLEAMLIELQRAQAAPG